MCGCLGAGDGVPVLSEPRWNPRLGKLRGQQCDRQVAFPEACSGGDRKATSHGWALWQEHEAKLEMSRIEIVESSLQMASAPAAAIVPARTEDEPGTRAANAKAETQPPTPDRNRPDVATTSATSVPSWVPERHDSRARWRKAYSILRKMRAEYLDPADWSDNPEPTLDEYRDRLKAKMKWSVSSKTVGRILKAGDNNWLK